MLSPNRLKELGTIYDQYISLLIQMEPRVILTSIIPWNSIKVIQLNIEAVSKLKEIDKIKLVFFSIDFKILYCRLIHIGVERILKVID